MDRRGQCLDAKAYWDLQGYMGGTAQILKGEMLLVSTSYEDQAQVKIWLLP